MGENVEKLPFRGKPVENAPQPSVKRRVSYDQKAEKGAVSDHRGGHPDRDPEAPARIPHPGGAGALPYPVPRGGLGCPAQGAQGHQEPPAVRRVLPDGRCHRGRVRAGRLCRGLRRHPLLPDRRAVPERGRRQEPPEHLQPDGHPPRLRQHRGRRRQAGTGGPR